MKQMFTAAVAAVLLTGAAADAADAAEPPGAAGATPIAGDAVFKGLHGKAGIDRIVVDLVRIYTADPRIRDIFAGHDLAALTKQLQDQICYIAGGPCAYSGRSMAEAHKNLGVQRTDFNALVEDLQTAMDHEGVAFPIQNRLLAKLAPMQRDIVER